MNVARQKARELLRKQDFFVRLLADLRKAGLVGERRNALAVYIVAVSRLRPRPLSLLVKGDSSAGKNFLVRKVLRFFPKDCQHEISSLSDRALNYLDGEELRHSVIYLQEHSDKSRAAHPGRLLLSEGKLIHWVVTPGHGGMGTQRQVTAGPVACISTTTADRLAIDDESRHISIWIDESRKQTRQIAEDYDSEEVRLDVESLRVWKQVQRLLEERANYRIEKPEWFKLLVDALPLQDVRVRRYFPAFVEACKTVSLIRSFRKHLPENRQLRVDFVDFATTALILNRVFAETLEKCEGSEAETRDHVQRISDHKDAARSRGWAALIGRRRERHSRSTLKAAKMRNCGNTFILGGCH